MKTTLVLDFTIPAKKNSYRVSRNGGMYKPEKIKQFESDVGKEVMLQKCMQIPGTFSVRGKYFLSKGADLDNANTTLLDALELAGVIENDKLNIHIDIWKITAGSKRGCDITIAAI